MLLKEVLKLSLTKVARQERITAMGLAVSLAFTGITVACAQIGFHVPWTPVPITLQVFAVLLSGLVLGRKLGAISQIQYLLLGLAGAPVFYGFIGGPAALLGPSGGYLPGFVLGAYVTGMMWERSRSRSTMAAVTAGAAGTVFIYAVGVIWLSVYLTAFKGESMAWKAWLYGVAPFIGVDAVKAVAAALVVTGRRSGGRAI
jgi:biotin transport system substrate-specific component